MDPDNTIIWIVGDEDNYCEFIKGLRDKLSRCVDFFEGNERVDLMRHQRRTYLLAEQRNGKQPKRWIHIHVKVDRKVITLAVRDDNVYLHGFRNNTKSTWYQFGLSRETDEPTVHAEARFLGCDVTYADMVGKKNNLVNLKLGRSFVREAVSKLYDYDKESGNRADKETREYLAGLIVIICEAARMDQPYRAVKKDWDMVNNKDNNVNVTYISNWGLMSSALLCWRENRFDPSDEFSCPPALYRRLTKIRITIPDQALKIVSLVLNTRTPTQQKAMAGGRGQSDEPPPSKRGRFQQQSEQGHSRLHQQQQQRQRWRQQQQQGYGGGRSHSQQQETAADDCEVDGRPLVEVFSVRARYPLAGTIAIFDGKRGQIIYKNDSTQDSPPSPDDGVPRELLLTGPYKAVSADGSFTIEVKDRNSNKTGELTWDCYDEKYLYNERQVRKIEMNGGQEIEVTYAVLDDAVEANVVVNLRLREVTAQNRVYGEITALSHGIGLPRVVLLDPKLEREASIHVSREPLRLARSVLAVPFDCPLVINATLYDKPYRQGVTPIFEWKDINLTLCKQPTSLAHEENGVEVQVIISSPDVNPNSSTEPAERCSDSVCPSSRFT